MMMSYNSLVSGLQAKSILSNIHASLVQHDGWLTKENFDIYNFVLEDEDEDRKALLARDGMKDQLFSIHKDKDAKDFMLISYGLYHITNEKFQNELQANLPNLIFGEMIDINWESVTPKDILAYFKKDEISSEFPSLTKKLDEYKSNNSYVPFSGSLLKGRTKKFVTDIYLYFIESILSFLKYGKQNIILGNIGEEWNSVKDEKFDTIYLNCYKRINSLIEDLKNALLHLSDDGVIFMETSRRGADYEFLKYVIDNSILEAYFDFCLPPYHSIYILRKKEVSKVYVEAFQMDVDSYVKKEFFQKSIDNSILKDVNYNLNIPQIKCLLEYGEKGMSLNRFLTPYDSAKHNDKEGHIFCYKNFAIDYESVVIQSSDLDVDKIEKCRKVISPVLIMNTDKNNPKIVYVNASENLPVYVPYSYPIFSLNESIVCPEYIHYLCQNGTWTTAIKGCSDIASGYAYGYLDPWGHEIMVTWEETFLHECDIVPIPSLPAQKQKIEDARLLQKVMDDKNKAKEALFNQKEWLNEAHIRNTKHRLTNDLFPLEHDINKLNNYLDKSGGYIQKEDIISKATGRTVGALIESMLHAVKTIHETISDFTDMRKYTDKCKICISEYLKKYCENLNQKYSIPFKVETKGLGSCIKIEISPIALSEILDNIVGNAVRHGFIEEKNPNYVISFDLEITNDGMCRLSIANNGVPMTERAKNIYYERGSCAGSTGHTGIGGAIVKDVCDQFKGKTYISEKEGFPVMIVIEFPVLNL